MATASGKYIAIEADIVEVRQRQRVFIEQELRKSGLTPARRSELEADLKRAIFNENAARGILDEDADEEEKEKKKGDSGDGQQGSAGGSASGGDRSGDQSSGDREDTEEENEDGITDLDMFAFFLFLMEQDAKHPDAAPDTALDHKALEPVAAATLSLDREEKVASIDETYTMEHENRTHAPSAFLSSLEHQAALLGARAMQLRVHPDAVDLFKKKFGYEPHGTPIKQNGASLQRMRKMLVLAQSSRNSATICS
jgi:hypothetical protein